MSLITLLPDLPGCSVEQVSQTEEDVSGLRIRPQSEIPSFCDRLMVIQTLVGGVPHELAHLAYPQ